MRALWNVLQNVQQLDRRWLYLLLVVAIVVPLLRPLGLPIEPRPEVRAVFDTINKLPAGSTILVSADFEPAGKPELQPFLEALMRLAFQRNLRIVGMSLIPYGPPPLDEAWRHHANSKSYGVDFANLGFKEGKLIVMTKLGESVRNTYSEDIHGTPIDKLPILSNIRKLEDFSLVVLISSGYPGASEWIPQVHGRYTNKIVAAVVSVMGPDLVPFLGSGQLLGLVSGMAGAAQFETLVGIKGQATAGMDAQNFAHLLIIGAIVLANVAFVIGRRRPAESAT